MKELIVFDLDGTLAKSKSPLDAEMAELLTSLLGMVGGDGVGLALFLGGLAGFDHRFGVVELVASDLIVLVAGSNHDREPILQNEVNQLVATGLSHTDGRRPTWVADAFGKDLFAGFLVDAVKHAGFVDVLDITSKRERR
jgi:hypothetical protein